jgi:dipeptidyl aminopeptidase/acylaminoacyl peptidase
MKPQDFTKFVFPITPEISPNGSDVVFTVKTIDHETNSYKSALFMSKFNENSIVRFTEGKKQDSNAKWSSNSEFIAFLSTRTGVSQLFVIKAAGGEAYQITNFSSPIIDFRWNSDASQFIVLSEVTQEEIKSIIELKEKTSFILEPEESESLKAKSKIKKELNNDPRIITEGYYREGNYYLNNKFKQVFLIDFNLSSLDLIEGINSDNNIRCISEFGFHYTLGEFSIDNRYVYVSRVNDPTINWKTEIIEVDTSSNYANNILITHGAGISGLKISPNGENLIYQGIRLESEQHIYDNQQIFLFPLKKREKDVICLTKDFSRSVSQAKWLSNETIIFLCNQNGKTSIEILDLFTNKVTSIFDKDQMINYFSVSRNNKLTFEASHINEYINIFVYDKESKILDKITNSNKFFLEKELALLKEIDYSREGLNIQGWLLLPENYKQRSKIPLVVEIHGGPAVMWSPHEKTMWFEFQLLVTSGYAVFFCNPRGSDGYGIDFRKKVFQDWGDSAGMDIIVGLDHVLLEFPFLDSKKIFVTGGSYGGYMTTWLVTHHDRFKAAVAQRGVYEFTAFAQTTDIPLWFEYGYNFELIDPKRNTVYERDSPANHIKNLNCPLLIIHSENDFRVPIVNGEQLFWLGKRYGKKVEFVRYPREGHELSRSGEPRHIIDRLSRIIGWFNTYNN